MVELFLTRKFSLDILYNRIVTIVFWLTDFRISYSTQMKYKQIFNMKMISLIIVKRSFVLCLYWYLLNH